MGLPLRTPHQLWGKMVTEENAAIRDNIWDIHYPETCILRTAGQIDGAGELPRRICRNATRLEIGGEADCGGGFKDETRKACRMLPKIGAIAFPAGLVAQQLKIVSAEDR
jgi:hypothetical protein